MGWCLLIKDKVTKVLYCKKIGRGCLLMKNYSIRQKESRLRELIRYMFYSVQTEFDSVQSADKLSASNIYSSLTYIYPMIFYIA